MSLAPGQSLLHFRLVEKIGEGGMGEVWRAVDTTLDREVAVKVLPPAFANDPERIARLEREAKLLASLNNPNIAAIYGFPEAPSTSSLSTGSGPGVRFLAMELVRGEDLSQILSRGPLPLREAMDAAKQVAAALEAAHDNGVIHRDLKPANVKRTPEGQIKVLDFGLAKALESAGPASAHSATVTSAGSAAGMILGTASYMSPEQARGLVVDRRTDLWAFGCLLYEMLTGVKAFDGPTVTDVLAAVVTGEPDWNKLPAATPASVRRLLRRCLEKDVRKRLRDAGDASLLLEDNPADTIAHPVAPVSAPRTPLFAAIALIAIAAAALGGYWFAHRGVPANAGAAIAFHRVTFSRGMMRAARFAPDGQTIVYGAAWNGPPVKLYLSRIESAEATPIGLPPAELLSISKSGDMAVSLGHAYAGWMGQGTLARTPLLGGSPRELLEDVRSADWSPDGSELAVVRRVNGVDQLEYPAGKVLYKNPGYIADVRISQDGERIAFTDHPLYADDRGDAAVVDRSGRKTMLATGFESIRGTAWAPGGKEVWFTGMKDTGGVTLYASDLAGHTRVVYASIAPIELFDIAPDGRLLLGSHKSEKQAQALLAGFTEARNVIIPSESSMARAVSPDGKALLVTNNLAKDYETYVVRSDRPGAVRLSAGDGMAISPDGSTALAAASDGKTLYLTPLGMGATRTIPNPDELHFESCPVWLPDGKRLVLTGRHPTETSRAYVLDVATGAAKAFGPTGAIWPLFGPPPVSPDGKFVVLQTIGGAPARWQVDGGDPLPIPGLASGDLPLAWSEDGAFIFVGGQTNPIPIVRIELATGKRSPWMTIAPTDAAGLRYILATITPNGKYWTLSIARLLTDLYVVDGLR